ncbi:acyl-CoA thioesterase, partial [Staphylococcus cohnii]
DGEERAKMRKIKRSQTKNIIESLDINKPWELE